uniref:G-protein coupled receptors family 3 profile domain-containing protein n=1 Tax=Cricetulus griseus TaxID=10029 RepID=A0A8C2MW81_CRIGR
MLSFIFLVLNFSFPFCSLTDPVCFWRIKDKNNWEGDKEVDCLFSIYMEQRCMKNYYFSGNLDKQLTLMNIHLISSLYFAMEEINRNSHILPNISLMVNIKCNLVNFPNYYCKNQRKYIIVLTGPMWLLSAVLGPSLYMSGTPELYYGHFQPLLNAHEQFPHLYQMSFKDTSLPLAMVSLVVHFRWNWVGVIISNEDSGTEFLSELREEMQRNIVCLAFVSIITIDAISYFKMADNYYNQIMMSSAEVVIKFGESGSVCHNWIGSQLWVIFSLTPSMGLLFFSHKYTEMSGFKQFFQTVHPSNYNDEISLGKLWWIYFDCSLSSSNCTKLKDCSTKTLLKWLYRNQFGMAMSDISFTLYNAVYAVAHSLHEMLLQHVDTWSKNDGKELEFDSQQMFSILKNIQFINPAGDLDTVYDIFYITDLKNQNALKVKIGKFSGHFPCNQQLYMYDERIEWTTDFRQTPPSICSSPCSPGQRKSPQEGKAVCCFDCNHCLNNEISNMTSMDHCVKCPDDQYANTKQIHCLKKVVTFLAYEDLLGMSLAVVALFFSSLTVVVLTIFLKYQGTPIVKGNNQVLSYVLLLSLIFCFLCPLLYIGHPHTATCILQQTTFAIVFTMATSSILAKTITVVLAFKVTVPDGKIRWLLASGAPNFIIPICTTIQVILCRIWLGTSPPFVDGDTQAIHGHILIVCNKGSVTAFYCVLGYLGSLALASFAVAFMARNLPDTFSEAKYMTFSMLVFCSVWATFLPVYQSTKGKCMVAVEVFCILAPSAGLLLCIFAPKCYIILFKPEINSLHKFRKT